MAAVAVAAGVAAVAVTAISLKAESVHSRRHCHRALAAACAFFCAFCEITRRLGRRWFTWQCTLRLGGGSAADAAVGAAKGAQCEEALVLCACAEPHERFDAELAAVRGRADTTVLVCVALRLAPSAPRHAVDSLVRTLRGALDAVALCASSPGSLRDPAAAALWLRAHARVRRGGDGAPRDVRVTVEGLGTRPSALLDAVTAALRLRADGAPCLRATLLLDSPLREALAAPPCGTVRICCSARLRTVLLLWRHVPQLACAALLGALGRLPAHVHWEAGTTGAPPTRCSTVWRRRRGFLSGARPTVRVLVRRRRRGAAATARGAPRARRTLRGHGRRGRA
jgi:hypothetical protein